MTEENFKQLTELKEKIDKVEHKLSIVNHLIRSKELSMKIEGKSDCRFKVPRYIYLSDIDTINSILEKTRMDLKQELFLLNQEFSQK